MRGKYQSRLIYVAMAAAAPIAIAAATAPAYAQSAQRSYSIPTQDMGDALRAFALSSGIDVVFDPAVVAGKRSNAVSGFLSGEEALRRLVDGSGLVYRRTASGGFAITGPAGGKDRAGSAENGDAVQADQVDQDIVVTGTNIRGVRAAGTALDVFSRHEIEQTGAGTVVQFLERLPQNHASVSGDSTIDPGSGSNSNNAAGVNLKGLGSSQTLILLNGRRVAPSGLGTITDVSMIPVAALDRIEVLSDGASAIYGSDAVAGVVNFVLLDEYEGAETRLRRETRVDSGSDRTAFNQTIGTNWRVGGALLSVGASRNDPLLARDRPYINTGPRHFFDAKENEISALLAVHQEVTPRSRLAIDGFYSRAKSVSQIDFAKYDIYSEHSARTKAYNVNANIDYRPGGEWAVRAFAARGASDMQVHDRITSDNDNLKTVISEVGAKLDGPLFTLPSGVFAVAIGASARWEENSRQSDSLDRLGYLFPPLNRRVDAAFAEMNIPIYRGSPIPLIRSFAVSAAVRHENYSDFGKTTNPRFGADWIPLKDIKIRASYGTSFSAARYTDVSDSFNSGSIHRIQSDLCEGGCLVFSELGNRSSYRPERSKSFTAGLEFKPTNVQGLSIDLGYYWTRYTDKIGFLPNSEYILQNLDNFAGIAIANPSAELIGKKFADLSAFVTGVSNYTGEVIANDQFDFYLDRRLVNLGATETSGDILRNAVFAGAGNGAGICGSSWELHSWIRGLGRPHLAVDPRVQANSPSSGFKGNGKYWRIGC